MKFQTAFMAKADQVRPVIECEPETKTKQDEAAACDINNIMARYQTTGVINHLASDAGFYGDASRVAYEEAFNMAEDAQKVFARLPSETRARFDNDVPTWLAAVEGATTTDELQLALLGKLPEPEAPPPETPEPPPTPSNGLPGNFEGPAAPPAPSA